jgi:AraC family transcriptional regulator of adaptative response / DNA-3-methyladenine glycosylase II
MNAMSTTGLSSNLAANLPLASATQARPELDPASCWQAVDSRDRRFDGRLFAGIATTGIYCRSICPVSFGHQINVRWFHSAKAAEAAGFRPCKRCRPDTSPGSAAWFGTLTVVSRALTLISQGALDDGSLERLADRVGIGTRHLRRLFDQHLGVSPLKIARSHRLQVAKNLILDTKCGAAEIASRAGFKSIRQFNHSVRATFGQSPTEIRSLHRVPEAAGRETGIVVHLPYRAPFDWSSLYEFLKARATPGVEAIDGHSYRRTIEIDGRAGTIEVWHEADRARVSMRVILPSCDCLMEVVGRVRRMFDLEADPVHIDQHLAQDARLAKMLAERPGLRVPGAWDGFELAVRAVLGERLTVAGAPVLAERLVLAFGQPVRTEVRELSHLFPRPQILAEANLTDLGVPADKAETICSLAHAVAEGKVSFNSSKSRKDTHSWLHAHPSLNQGIASYIAMRAFGEPDAFPHTDRGLRQALAIRGRPISDAKLLLMFNKFRPWRAYTAMHFSAAMQKTGDQIGERAEIRGKDARVAGSSMNSARKGRYKTGKSLSFKMEGARS